MKTKVHIFFISLVLNSFSVNLSAEDAITPAQAEMLKTLPPDQRDLIQSKMLDAKSLNNELQDLFESKTQSLTERPKEDEKEKCEECIFGYDYFQYSPTTFAPVDTTPVTPGYVLGPGDQIIVNFYGSEEREVETYINREGKAVLPFIGPINFLGLTYEQASSLLSKRVDTELIGVEVSMSIGEIRSTVIVRLSPGITISTPLGSSMFPVTSVVLT